MKYDNQLVNLKAQIPSIKKALVAIPAGASIDKLAAALSLSLALKQAGKEVTIVCPDTLTVSQSHLFGIGDIKNQIPAQSEGNYVISLAGVVDQNGLVPALQGLDWYPEGQNLNLVFKINPGQTFEPKEIAARHETGGNFNMIFVVGSPTLNDLGAIYQNGAVIFGQAPIVNIDNNPQNGNFGWTNVVDPQSSLSEMMVTIISSLGFLIDGDIATNILHGIYDATANLTQNVTADTFMAAGLALQSGGKLPMNTQAPNANQPVMSQPPVTYPAPEPQMNYPQPEIPQPTFISTPPQETPIQASQSEATPIIQMPQDNGQNPAYDLSKIFGIPPVPGSDFVQTTPDRQDGLVNPQAPIQDNNQASVSQQETPIGEVAVTPTLENPSNPTPDWLVPKIYSGKGGGLG